MSRSRSPLGKTYSPFKGKGAAQENREGQAQASATQGQLKQAWWDYLAHAAKHPNNRHKAGRQKQPSGNSDYARRVRRRRKQQ
jgi:hypothetical protein